MNIQHAILLGFIQGISEFLPISSSGHLYLIQHFLHIRNPSSLFTIILHTASLIAVCFIYRDAIIMLLHVLWRTICRKQIATDTAYIRYIVFLLFSTIITASLALTIIHPFIYAPSMKALTIAFFSSALILSSSYFTTQKIVISQLRWYHALLIGIAQACAAIPGISRSGTSITMGLWCGLSQKESAQYSFLLIIPAIIGALILELLQYKPSTLITPSMLLLGFTMSLFSSFFALKLFFILQKKYFFSIFIWYLFTLSGILLYIQ